jgi:anti-sigma factor RsiW
MKQDIQLKLQAYLDGELPSGEAKDMADLIARDTEARDLLTELTHTRAAFASHESDLKVSATREFYWSQIKRGIERQERTATSRPPETSIFTTLRRLLVPASGLAAILLAVMLAGHQFRLQEGIRSAETDTSFEDADAFTYRDYSSGTTLVWFNYPAENEFTEMDTDDILGLD